MHPISYGVTLKSPCVKICRQSDGGHTVDPNSVMGGPVALAREGLASAEFIVVVLLARDGSNRWLVRLLGILGTWTTQQYRTLHPYTGLLHTLGSQSSQIKYYPTKIIGVS